VFGVAKCGTRAAGCQPLDYSMQNISSTTATVSRLVHIVCSFASDSQQEDA